MLLYVLLVACMFKANVFSLLYIVVLFMLQLCISNSTRRMLALTRLIAVMLVLQYGALLTTLNSMTSPLPLPVDHVSFVSDWIKKISENPDFRDCFTYYFQLGSQRVQVNYLWF